MEMSRYARKKMMKLFPQIVPITAAQVPSWCYMCAAMWSILISLAFFFRGKPHASHLVGQWVPTFLILGIYRKLIKLAFS